MMEFIEWKLPNYPGQKFISFRRPLDSQCSGGTLMIINDMFSTRKGRDNGVATHLSYIKSTIALREKAN